MNSEELQMLLGRDESIKLEFKQEYKLNKNPPAGTNAQLWTQFTNGQWDEFTKDIIALANGNVGVATSEGVMIIGAADHLSPDGTRQLYDMRELQITEQQVLSKVNKVCQPPLPQVRVEQIVIDGKTIAAITVPPTPYVHETNRQLTIYKGVWNADGMLTKCIDEKIYTQYTAFIRKGGEEISPASWAERREIERDKRFEVIAINESIKSELIYNLGQLLGKIGNIFVDPIIIIDSFKTKHRLELNKIITVDRSYLDRLHIIHIHAYATPKRLSTQFLDEAILSGKYLDLDAKSGIHKNRALLDFFYKLQLAIGEFKSICEMPDSLGNNFLTKYTLTKNPGPTVQVQCNDILFIMAIIYRYEDVIKLSAALLKYLINPNEGLTEVNLNPSTPLWDQVEGIEKEKLTTDEILQWVLNC